jgi:hypothetical protein
VPVALPLVTRAQHDAWAAHLFFDLVHCGDWPPSLLCARSSDGQMNENCATFLETRNEITSHFINCRCGGHVRNGILKHHTGRSADNLQRIHMLQSDGDQRVGDQKEARQ